MMRTLLRTGPCVFAFLLAGLLLVPSSASATWSVIAIDRATGQIVIASATCVSAEGLRTRGGLMSIQAIIAPGVGVAAAQAGVDRTRENQTLIHRELLRGTHPERILEMLHEDPDVQRRQFAILDREGRHAGFSGSENRDAALVSHGQVPGTEIFYSVQGNILANDDVVHEGVRALTETEGELSDRVMASMEASDAAGGDARCTCETEPTTGARQCTAKTSHVAYIVVANPDDAPGDSYNDGDWHLFIDVDDENIRPDEDANPVVTLRARYDELRAGHGRAQAPSIADYDPDYLSTYSIIARDAETGQLGVGVQSKAFAAGNRAQHLRAGVAAIAHQASANPMYGPMGVELLQRGFSPEVALEMMVQADEGRDRRQVAIIDMDGRTAAWTGESTSDWAGHRCGVNYCAQGNILSGPEVVDAMAESFESSSGPLEYRLMEALDAAETAGGDARGKQSGGIFVTEVPEGGGYRDMVVDIRVDDHREPLVELRRILDLRRSGQIISEANQLLSDGDVEGAVARAEAATELSPENDRAWVALARIYLEAGRRSDALASVREAMELQPARMGLQLREDSAFAALRDDPEFQRLTNPNR